MWGIYDDRRTVTERYIVFIFFFIKMKKDTDGRQNTIKQSDADDV